MRGRPKNFRDITNQVFSRLTALSYLGSQKWKCVCSCDGKEVIVNSANLFNSHTQSCGCLQRERTSKAKKIHGMSATRIFGVWSGMIQRCTNPKQPRWPYYGGRGIIVCERWRLGEGAMNGFQCFYHDMGDRPFEGAEIERKDNDGNYCPENCKWATHKEESNNRRSSHNITFSGRTQTAKQWEEELNLPLHILRTRLKVNKWSVERAFTTPIRRYKQREAIVPATS